MAVTLDNVRSREVPAISHEANARQADCPEKNRSNLVNEHFGPPDKKIRDVCPECGQKMQPDGRCFVCRACGYSECG